MSWVKLDDGLPNNRKWRRLVRRSPEAACLWVASMCYSALHLTDGRIPKDEITEVGPFRNPERLALVLVDLGMFDDDGTAWAVHDYHSYNPPASEVLDKREQDRQRKAAARARGTDAAGRRPSGQFGGVPPDVPADIPKDVPPESAETSTATRPVPSRTPPPSSNSDLRSPCDPSAEEEDSKPQNGRSDAERCADAYAWLARYDLEQVQVRGTQTVRNPAAWLARAAENRRVRHAETAPKLIARHPDWSTEQLAGALAAGDSAAAAGEASAAAARALMERNELPACGTCDSTGWVDTDAGVVECRACNRVGVGGGR